MRNLFLTGDINVGKSTLLRKVLDNLDNSIGGFVTQDVSNRSDMKQYQLISLYDGDYGYNIGNIKNMIENRDKVIKIFDEVGCEILEKSVQCRDIIVMDEIGVIESQALKFQNIIKNILNSEKIVLGVLKKADSSFLNYIKSREDTVVIDVTKDNRDGLVEKIMAILYYWNVKVRKGSYLRWNDDEVKYYKEALNHPKNKYPYVFMEEIKKSFNTLNKVKVLDIGAGVGTFTFPLLKEGAIVTAVDSSFSGCKVIRDEAVHKSIKDLNCFISDWTKIKYFDTYDIGICAFCFNGIEDRECLQKLMSIIKSKIYIITHKKGHHNNFKSNEFYKRIGRVPRKKSTESYKSIVEGLEELNLKYRFKEITFPFGQYFKNTEDAEEFFLKHFKVYSENEKCILKEFINENLRKSGDEWVFPNYRESVMIEVDLA